jgi:hypothetical protein
MQGELLRAGHVTNDKTPALRASLRMNRSQAAGEWNEPEHQRITESAASAIWPQENGLSSRAPTRRTIYFSRPGKEIESTKAEKAHKTTHPLAG